MIEKTCSMHVQYNIWAVLCRITFTFSFLSLILPVFYVFHNIAFLNEISYN